MRRTGEMALVLGLAGVEAAVGVGGAALRHAGWWLDWHTRSHPGGGCQPSGPAEHVRAAVRHLSAA